MNDKRYQFKISQQYGKLPQNVCEQQENVCIQHKGVAQAETCGYYDATSFGVGDDI